MRATKMGRRSFVLTSAAALHGAAPLPDVTAMVFDVFGTVVDWRSTIIREGEALGRKKGLKADWAKFADAWRAAYAPAMNRVRKGELPWTKIDDLHRMALDRILVDFAVQGLDESEKDHLNRVWHRLDPWPDAVEGLTRLRRRYLIATLSNGNVSLLAEMAKHARLPWDCILSAELFKHYKPDPEVYRGAADLLSLEPARVMMVAAHGDDLRAARATGMLTGYVPRPLEYGPGRHAAESPGDSFDVTARDFLELASRMGA
jgi:2-haloacid dehalogenase